MRLNATVVVLCCSCAGTQPGPPSREVPAATPGDPVDVLTAALGFNVEDNTASATIDFVEPPIDSPRSIRFEKGDLQIAAVADPNGPLKWSVRGEHLDIGLPKGTRQVRIDYNYGLHEREFRPSNGGALTGGSTRTWPVLCGNLFPCNSSPADGARYRIALSGLTADQVGVFPPTIAADAPSYMPAWAVGAYRYRELGKTEAGTIVGTYYTEEHRVQMSEGTSHLVGAFDWFEKTLGPYPFGDRVASVEVDWGEKAASAMEHHPYWHVASDGLANSAIHIHEAAHGWYGNGVRMACWEDAVLSEGVVSYLTARALELEQSELAEQMWRDRRNKIPAGVAWPTGCDENDVMSFLGKTYIRGALFFRTLEEGLGRENLDDALASFFIEHRGRAARFSDLLDHIEARSGTSVLECAVAWLRAASSVVPTCTF